MRKTLFLLMFAVFGMMPANAQSPYLLFQKQQQLQMTIEKIQEYFVVKEEDKDLFEEQVQRLNKLSKTIESGKLDVSQAENELSDIESKISSAQKVPAQLPLLDTWFINVPSTIVPIPGTDMDTAYMGPYEGWGGEGPWTLAGDLYFASQKRLKATIYVPKAEFLDTSDKRLTLQGYNECPRVTDFSNYEKIYEYPNVIETHKAADGDYYVTEMLQETDYSWDGLSDIEDSVTHEKKPVFDCASVVFEDADTGLPIYDPRGPADSNIGRYMTSISQSIKFSQTTAGVKADIWFAVGPGKPIIKMLQLS
jgi:hypothetical protein